jgi:hypothetical protein
MHINSRHQVKPVYITSFPTKFFYLNLTLKGRLTLINLLFNPPSSQSAHIFTDMTPLSDEQLASRTEFSKQFRADIDSAVTLNDEKKLWQTAYNFPNTINQACSRGNKSPALYEFDLHDLWYIYIQIAKAAASDDLQHDRLVRQIMTVKSMESIRYVFGLDATIEELSTSDGVVWTDLPFLGLDIYQSLEQNWTDMSVVQRCNLASFIGRLVAVDANSSLNFCALWLLRSALEVSFQVARNSENISDQLGLDETLSPAVSVLRYCAHKVLILSIKEFSIPDALKSTLSPGRWIGESSVKTSGFSLTRWHLWKERLDYLRNNDLSNLTQEGLHGFNLMDMTEKNIRVEYYK